MHAFRSALETLHKNIKKQSPANEEDICRPTQDLEISLALSEIIIN
jgi:hypothetical protein